jgi:hypothetical protein
MINKAVNDTKIKINNIVDINQPTFFAKKEI